MQLNMPQLAGLPWTRDRPVAEISIWHTTLTTDRSLCPGGIRTRNLSKRMTADLRLRQLGHCYCYCRSPYQLAASHYVTVKSNYLLSLYSSWLEVTEPQIPFSLRPRRISLRNCRQSDTSNAFSTWSICYGCLTTVWVGKILEQL
jgi:hypothetical protein